MAKVVLEEAPVDEIVQGPPPGTTAPMPPVATLARRGRGPRMEDALEAAGAEYDADEGVWIRWVPDPRLAKEIVLRDDKPFYQTTYTPRLVATGGDWREALAKAQADQHGLTDALIPGRGWARAGRKLETEHPSNLGNLDRVSAKTKVSYEEAPEDAAEALKASALVRAARVAGGVPAQPLED